MQKKRIILMLLVVGVLVLLGVNGIASEEDSFVLSAAGFTVTLKGSWIENRAADDNVWALSAEGMPRYQLVVSKTNISQDQVEPYYDYMEELIKLDQRFYEFSSKETELQGRKIRVFHVKDKDKNYYTGCLFHTNGYIVTLFYIENEASDTSEDIMLESLSTLKYANEEVFILDENRDNSLGVTSGYWYSTYSWYVNGGEVFKNCGLNLIVKKQVSDYTVCNYEHNPHLSVQLFCDKTTDEVLDIYVSTDDFSNQSENVGNIIMLCIAATDVGTENIQKYGDAIKQFDEEYTANPTIPYRKSLIIDDYVIGMDLEFNNAMNIRFCRKAYKDIVKEKPEVAFSSKEEIKFRGVDWGLPYSETMKALSSLDVKWDGTSLASGRTISAQASGSWSGYYKHDCLVYTSTSYSSPQITVAGYKTSDITLYFACVEKNGVITHSNEDTAFYMAQYEFTPKDLEAVYSDFVDKLSAVYGKPDKQFTDNGIITYNFTYWLGDNDTMVILTSDDNWKTIKVNYVWEGGEELMKKADELQRQAELDEESSNFGTDNTDGL